MFTNSSSLYTSAVQVRPGGKPPSLKAGAKDIIMGVMSGANTTDEFFAYVKQAIQFGTSAQVKTGALKASNSPYGFCNKYVNRFRAYVHE
jgi:hypothetical protein